MDGDPSIAQSAEFLSFMGYRSYKLKNNAIGIPGVQKIVEEAYLFSQV